MRQLIHNGVLIPRYDAKGFCICIRGVDIKLSSEQEEMAVAWVKKLGTEYVKDKTFAKNFFQDFLHALNKDKVRPEDFDFYEIQQHIMKEKNRKLTMSREIRKKEAQKRKAIREINKEKYGYAVVDGLKVEIANYVVEPSSIFMGRGKHPLRGRWKRGADATDVVLNFSPNASIPKGDWKAVVWQPDSMWIAKWSDKLQGKTKYVWLSDTSPVKQNRDIEKFDKARDLESQLKKVNAKIMRSLTSSDPLRRKIATVCYLIDFLKFRVGDEKGQDEADTVGATTLRPEHLSFKPNGIVIFDFLGKDSIRWHLKTKLPEQVVRNIKESCNDANSSIFNGVRSDNVSTFLDEAMQGLSAKVFRTYHATKIVRTELVKAKVSKDDHELKKKLAATMANLKASKTCNHKKKIPKNWNASLDKMKVRLNKYKEKRKEIKAKKTRKEATKIRRLRTINDRIRNVQTRIKIKKAIRDYNLNTTLKSYIDPRVYFQWGNKVGYDWKKYYSKALQRKFLWVENETSDTSSMT